MKLCDDSVVEDVLLVDPGTFFRTVPLPVHQVLEETSSASRIQQAVDLISLFTVDHDGWRALNAGLTLLLRSRATRGF